VLTPFLFFFLRRLLVLGLGFLGRRRLASRTFFFSRALGLRLATLRNVGSFRLFRRGSEHSSFDEVLLLVSTYSYAVQAEAKSLVDLGTRVSISIVHVVLQLFTVFLSIAYIP